MVQDHNYLLQDEKISSNEKKTILVVILTFITMIVEVTYDHITNSMALLANGWHMGSHVGALGISVMAYRMARSPRFKHSFNFGTGKFVPLGGYTSAILLGLVAFLMIVESVERLMNPNTIQFTTAIGVAVVGLIVNVISALILKDDHHHDHDDDHKHLEDHVHDHNHHSALVHVIADALTSVLAIVALLLGQWKNWQWADPVMGVVGAVVILRWAYKLCKDTGWELLDGNSKAISKSKIVEIFINDNVEIIDLHIWRIAPSAHACELVVKSDSLKGAMFYREKILNEIEIEHLIIEEIE